MGTDPLDEGIKEREALVRKHGIPLPLFRAFLRTFGKKYRGKFSKFRAKFARYRRLVDPEECWMCDRRDETVRERKSLGVICCDECAKDLA
jgi:hypothetical protein